MLRGDPTYVHAVDGTTTITVPSTTTVYSRTFRLNYGQSFGIQYQAGNGSGTANMKIELEQSNVALTNAQQGAASTDYVVGAGVPDIVTSLSGNTTQLAVLTPIPAKYGRLKITGLAANPANASLVAQIFQQEIVI